MLNGNSQANNVLNNDTQAQQTLNTNTQAQTPLPPPLRATPSRGVAYAEPARPYQVGDAGGLFDHEMRPTTSFRGPASPTLPFPRVTRTQVIVGAGALASVLILSAVVALGSGARVAPPVALAAPVAASVRATPSAGARVSIGSVAYPPAPLSVELPPGEYDVRVRTKHRALTRHISIAAGENTQL
jgi:hypothetical protein